MRDSILVDKELLPYSFDILLGAEWFNLGFKYNENAGVFTVTLSKDEQVIVYDEPLMYGLPLFNDLYQSGVYPMMTIVPWDESQQETAVTWDNFGVTVFLTIEQGDDSDEQQLYQES